MPFHSMKTEYVCIAPQWFISHMPHLPQNYITHLAAARGMSEKLKQLKQLKQLG